MLRKRGFCSFAARAREASKLPCSASRTIFVPPVNTITSPGRMANFPSLNGSRGGCGCEMAARARKIPRERQEALLLRWQFFDDKVFVPHLRFRAAVDLHCNDAR